MALCYVATKAASRRCRRSDAQHSALPLTIRQLAPAMMRRACAASARNEANLMAMGLSEAAAATGVNRSTIYRAYKSGRMNATRLETGCPSQISP
jgi:hypothetical protein